MLLREIKEKRLDLWHYRYRRTNITVVRDIIAAGNHRMTCTNKKWSRARETPVRSKLKEVAWEISLVEETKTSPGRTNLWDPT